MGRMKPFAPISRNLFVLINKTEIVRFKQIGEIVFLQLWDIIGQFARVLRNRLFFINRTIFFAFTIFQQICEMDLFHVGTNWIVNNGRTCFCINTTFHRFQEIFIYRAKWTGLINIIQSTFYFNFAELDRHLQLGVLDFRIT